MSLNLQLNSYPDHLKLMVKGLYEDENSKDVTLVCDDKIKIKAHKIILKAFSPMFQLMLNEGDDIKPIVFLKGIQHQELISILQFIYLGETNVEEERMHTFLDVANSLEIEDVMVKESEEEQVEQLQQTQAEDNASELDESVNNIIESKEAMSEVQEEMENLERDFGKLKNKLRGLEDQNDATEEDNKTVKSEKDIAQRQPMTRIQRRMEKKKTFLIDPRTKYYCDQCQFEAFSRGQLTKHIKVVHQGLRFQCDICNYTATAMQHLRHHIESKHEGIKHSCHLCKSEFSRADNLKTHYRLYHRGEQV